MKRRTFLTRGLQAAGVTALAGSAGGVVTRTIGGLFVEPDISPAVLTNVGAPAIVTRSGWGADESLRTGDRDFAKVKKLIVHHTVTTNDETDPALRIRAIYEGHVLVNGWSDIGYNFLVDQQGRVYEGRWARNYKRREIHTGENRKGTKGVVGAHALNHNAGSVGVALLGTFTGGGQPTDAAVEGLVRVLAWKAARHEIDPLGSSRFENAVGERSRFPNIVGHLTVRSTSCPGVLNDMLPDIRTRVAALIAGGLIGYRVLRTDASVGHFGAAPRVGDAHSFGVSSGAVAVAAPRDERGYWTFFENGGVFTHGGLDYHGSAAGLGHGGIVDAVAHPKGRGYALLSRTGGIYALGRFPFLGSGNGIGLDGNPVALILHPGGGYSIVTDLGAVYAFGAPFFGAANRFPHQGIVGGAAHPKGRGMWLLSRDGSVFALGGASYHGNMHGIPGWAQPAVAVLASATGKGYGILASDGAVYAFGDFPFWGSDANNGRGAVAIAPYLRSV